MAEVSIIDSITTCLSSPVYDMVCKTGFDLKDNYDINSILSQDGEVYWKTIAEYLCYSESDQSVDYQRCVRLLGPMCQAVHLHLLSLTKDQFAVQYVSWFQWTNFPQLFLEIFDALQSLQLTAISLSLMKLTSCLERALGDVFLLIGKGCPFLLRDLLSSQELSEIFGPSVMDLLRVFIGSPNGLNLRNILWHGFASPQEIPPKYCSTLLLLTAGLGQLLESYLQKTKFTLTHRPSVTFTNLDELDIFPDINHEALSVAQELLKKSGFVLKIMLPFWEAAITEFRLQRYAESVMLLLPQLETGLRKVFITVNKCAKRLLTAEHSALYTTFDEEFLWDFLNHQEGPRLHSVYQHGLQGHSESQAYSLKISNQQSPSNLNSKPNRLFMENATIKALIGCADSYRSHFHPVSRLKKQVLDCEKSISAWNQLPVVPEEQIQEVTRLDSSLETNDCQAMIIEIFSELQRHMPWRPYVFNHLLENPTTENWSQLLSELCGLSVRTLYCPRSVLEVLTILRKISRQCLLVSDQVIAITEIRYQQWRSKTLRSRQRQNYVRMLNSIKFLSPVLLLILLLISLELVNVHGVCEKHTSEYQWYLKFLKSILQYTENLVTYTSLEKNKWDEALDLTQNILIKIRAFSQKNHTLMHLSKHYPNKATL
ncbi:endoplasmic reticulum membrane-associated RNA degradation protein isoform X6 [Ornithorhynchus anatinus]|uniref:endoplasmic reticulum membrane-associated RNA degradation protein isoform X6 n=1 Tax=Ornithorhynchus anatinus TaxID=9258 RepID=UPI0010A7556F|nr:endoplasmic reticulum membrane-associated RNA degradation protein isoform X6 [Ornithorhynchus anatinus]